MTTTREAIVALVMDAPADWDGDAAFMLADTRLDHCKPEDRAADCAQSELACLFEERTYDDEPGKRKYTEHAGHLVRIAVLILRSAAAWMEKAKPKKREPKPADPQVALPGVKS